MEEIAKAMTINPVHADPILLPAFDEYIISYKSKHIAVTNHHLRKAVSGNGVFRPVIIKDGQVRGFRRNLKSKSNPN
jgi:hypothetical protein